MAKHLTIDVVQRTTLSESALFRVKQAMAYLDLNAIGLFKKTIVVGGTNGKGTTCFCLEAIARSTNRSVGLFSSPHLLSINERIRINGEPISDSALADHEAVLDRTNWSFLEKPLTFFERMFIAALMEFQRHAVELVIIEVGLGGRFCATNALSPNVTVLTGIDFDHTEILGETREKIGREKAGIFRQKVPIILADRHPPESVISAASTLDAPLIQIGKDWDVLQRDRFETTIKTACGDHIFFESLWLPAESIGAAIVSWETIYPPLEKVALQKTIASLVVQGRFHALDGIHHVMVDVAHNPQSLLRLQKVLTAYASVHNIRRWNIVFSMLSRKSLAKSLQGFKHRSEFCWYLPIWGEKKQFHSNQKVIEVVCPNSVKIFEGMHATLAQARSDARQAGQTGVIVTGSFLTVAAAIIDQKNQYKATN